MNDPVRTGWLSPWGEFIHCKSYEHYDIASKLCEKYAFPTKQELESCDQVLVENGWVRISISEIDHKYNIQWRFSLSEHQKRFLRPYFEEEYEMIPNEFSYMIWKYYSEVF